MSIEISSPCKGICQLDAEKHHCVGCYRTIDEISQWSRLSNEQKQMVIEQLSICQKYVSE